MSKIYGSFNQIEKTQLVIIKMEDIHVYKIVNKNEYSPIY